MKRIRKRIPLGLALVASFGISLDCARAALYTGLYAFGDSLTDTGNTSLASGGASPGPAYFNGRYSNGPVWVEYLARDPRLRPPRGSRVLGPDQRL